MVFINRLDQVWESSLLKLSVRQPRERIDYTVSELS